MASLPSTDQHRYMTIGPVVFLWHDGVRCDWLQSILHGQSIDFSVPAIGQAAGQDATLERWRRSIQGI